MGRLPLTVLTADGHTISVDHFRQGRRLAAVVICPGFFQSKDTATFQRMARALANDCDVIAMDFRGHGRSSGLYTFSARESLDLEAVLEWAKARYRRLGVLGFSLGAAIAMNTIGKYCDVVTSLVAVSGPSSFEEIEFKFWTPEAMRIGLQGLEPGAGCRPGNPLLEKPRPIDAIRSLAGLSKLFIHGTQDVIVGVAHSRRLYEAAAEPKRLEILERGRHAEALFRDEPERFCRLVQTWWRETLNPRGRDD